MIYDVISNVSLYKGLSANLDTALDFIAKLDKFNLQLGRNEIDDEKVFVNVVCARTKPPEGALFEYHKRYIDIHFIFAGEEKILVSRFDTLKTTTEYSQDSDCALQIGETQAELLMTNENFCVCFPEDSHLPLIMNNEPKDIKKGIIKVLI